MLKIGFCSEETNQTEEKKIRRETSASAAPVKSVVEVRFFKTNKILSYYNDLFDLHTGDIVYVDGKMEGLPGRVISVNYCFKIKLSDYRRVIGIIDTQVRGQFYRIGTHFATFDKAAIPPEKVKLWFMAPETEEEDYVSGDGDTVFPLDKPETLWQDPVIGERGYTYYSEKRVEYICVDGGRGYAIVVGSKPYEVEFRYRKDTNEISGITCSCFCSYFCKHELAAMLQLRELLQTVTQEYADEYKRADYLAAVRCDTLCDFVIASGNTSGGILLT